MTALSGTTRGLRRLKALDDRRPGMPGEHWVAFAAGLAAVQAGRRQHAPGWRPPLWALGGLLLARSLSGRDGPLARARRLQHDRAS